MKYYKFQKSYGKMPNSMFNMKDALCRIGEINPYNINLAKYSSSYRENPDKNNVKRKQLVYLGILNVKRRLNGHLGPNGKFTIRMIRLTATPKKKGNNSNVIKTVIPKVDYIRIASLTYDMLWQKDRLYCLGLLNKEKNDNLFAKEICSRTSLLSVVPVQTDCIISNDGRTERIKDFIEYVKKYAVGREGEYNE